MQIKMKKKKKKNTTFQHDKIVYTISERTDEGGVSDQNEADAGPISGDDDNITTSGVQETLGQLRLSDGQGDRLSDNPGAEPGPGLDDTDAQRIINMPSNTDFIVARATHPG